MQASRCVEIISCSLRMGYPEYASRIAQELLGHFPRHLEARSLLGQSLLEEGRLGKAEAAFKEVLKADPEGVEALVGLGLAAWLPWLIAVLSV